MDFSASTVTAPAAPRQVPDMRPTADAAATVRITKPALAVALPSPPATSQVAEVTRSMLRADAGVEGDASDRIAPVGMIERTLKPYGISMLPKSAEEAATEAKADQFAGAAASQDPVQHVPA